MTSNKKRQKKNSPKKSISSKPTKINTQISEEYSIGVWSKIWKSIENISAKAYAFLGGIIAFTGITILSFFPDVSIELKNPSDKNTLIFEITNKSWIAIKDVNTMILIDTLQTTHIDNIGKVMTYNAAAVYRKLSHNQSFTFDYSPSSLYGPDPNYSLFSARIALAVKYTFFGKEMEDYAFYDGVHDMNGSFLWRKMPERKFAKEIENDTTKLDTNRIPLFKNFERNTRGIPRGPMPPMPKIDSGDN